MSDWQTGRNGGRTSVERAWGTVRKDYSDDIAPSESQVMRLRLLNRTLASALKDFDGIFEKRQADACQRWPSYWDFAAVCFMRIMTLGLTQTP